MSEFGQDAQIPEDKAHRFRCPACAADMRFDPASGGMLCDFCSHQVAFAQEAGHQEIVEYDLQKGLSAAQQESFGPGLRSSKCQSCGASVCFGEDKTATNCDFCGSNQVLTVDSQRRLIRPESLVPFAVDHKKASGEFSSWTHRLWFRPSKLKHQAEIADIAGVYIPYWTFDSQVESDWTAQAGTYYYESESYTTTENGETVTKTRQVQKIRWRSDWGFRVDHYDDILICASAGVPEKLAKKLCTFDTQALQSYDPRYLAGFKAEEYVVELNDGWKQALAHMVSSQESRCGADVSGDTYRFLNVRNTFSDESFKHVLLPLWIASYRYNDKVYRFLVNGQTGEVVGTAPYSWVKITLAVIALFVVTAGIAAVVLR